MGKKSKPSRRKPQIKIDKKGKDYNPFPAPISQEKFKHPAANPLDSFTGEYNSDEEKTVTRKEGKDAVNENHVEQFMQSFTAVTDSLSAAEEVNTDTTAGEGATGGVWHEVLDTNTNCIYYWNQQDNITSWVIPTNATVVKLQSSTAADTDQMDSTAAPAIATSTAVEVAGETTDTTSEDLVEYGPQLPENYIPPSDEQSASVSESSNVSSRKRPTTCDDNTQDIDNMLDDALDVKRVRLDEGVDSVAGVHGNTMLSAEQLSGEISEKLRMLNASKLGVSTLQLVLIQYETRISDYNNGAISESYLMEKFQEATQALDTYAVSVAPAGWMCYWNGDAKRYCFHNQETGEYSWEYPTPQILSHTATASLQQPVGAAEESHTPLQPEEVKVTEPLEGPLGRQEVTNIEEATPTTVSSEVVTASEEESNDIHNLYSPQALPTNNDITDGSGDVTVNNVINTGDSHHDNNDNDIVAAPPTTSLTTPSGNITDSDDDIMATPVHPVKETSDNISAEEQRTDNDSDWVIVERPSVTSDDQSLESMDSLTEECVEVMDPIGSCDPASSLLGAQEEVIAYSNDDMASVEQSVVTTATVVTATSSSLPLDTANQDAGGSVADDEAEEDEMDDWWRSKGPSTTKPTTTSSGAALQPKWNSLKFTKQLKTRWGMTSANPVTMTTAKEPQATTVTMSKSSDMLAWFSEEEEKKELALPTAEEIAETKEREEQIAAAAAAKKERERERLLAKMEETAMKKDKEAMADDKQSQAIGHEDQEGGQPSCAANVDDQSTTVTMETVTMKATVAATEEGAVSEQQQQQPPVAVATVDKAKDVEGDDDDGSSSDSSDSSSSSSSSSSSFTLSSSGDSSSSEDEDDDNKKTKVKQSTAIKQDKEEVNKEQPVTDSGAAASATNRTDVKEQSLLEATELTQQQPISTENQQPLPSSEEPAVPEEAAVDDDSNKEPVVTEEQAEAMEIEASPEQSNDITKMEEEIVEAPTQDVGETPNEMEKAKVEQPILSAEQPLPSTEKQEIKESSATPAVNTFSQSAKPMTVAREESPPPPPPPSTTGAVAMATSNPHYASTSTSYSQSTASPTPTPGSEGYSAYLQAYAYYAAHAQAQAAQYYANYPQAAAYARMYQAYGSPYGNTSSYSNTSSYGNQYDSTSYYNYAARAYAAQAQNYSNSPGGHQSEDDSSARADKSKRK